MILEHEYRANRPPLPSALSSRYAWQHATRVKWAPEQPVQDTRHFQSCRAQPRSIDLLQLPAIDWLHFEKPTHALEECRWRLCKFLEDANVDSGRKPFLERPHVFVI